jgi:porphobilinogen synthase
MDDQFRRAAQHPLDLPTRMRRNRKAEWSRRLMRENTLSTHDLIWPIFVTEGQNAAEPIESMPGVERVTVDRAIGFARLAEAMRIPALAIFPNTDPAKRTDDAREALNSSNLVCRAVAEIKAAVPGIGLITDVALDPYTSHGHDGLLRNGIIVNDETVAMLCRQAIVQARAGCDVVAPSDMMDGRIGAIREALDDEGFDQVQILAYAAKYASCFYGPFRHAVGSSTTLSGDKKTYQMDPANGAEALREVALDIEEGADMIMVKPGMPYLDIIWRLKDAFGMPTMAYQVSGEYAMIMAAAERGWLDRDKAILESLMAFKRAGADAVLTYFAPQVAELLAKA